MKEIITACTPVSVNGEIVQYTREDGFTVFLDGDEELDFIRLHSDPLAVVKAVAVRRCQQIAKNYARKYAPEMLDQFGFKCLEVKKEVKYITSERCKYCDTPLCTGTKICPVCESRVIEEEHIN